MFLSGLLAITVAFGGADDAPQACTTSAEAAAKLQGCFEFERQPLTVAELVELSISAEGVTLPATDTYPAVVFAYVNLPNAEPAGEAPVILISSGHQWWILRVASTYCFWQDVVASRDRSRIWAALEFCRGDPDQEISLIYSGDGGWTWHTLSTIKKTYYLRRYLDMQMNAKGAGSLSMYLEEDDGICAKDAAPSSEEAHQYCQGWDIYHTEDWGSTWVRTAFVHGKAGRFRYPNPEAENDMSEWKASLREDFSAAESDAKKEPTPEKLNLAPGLEELPLDIATCLKADRAFYVADFGEALDLYADDQPGLWQPLLLLEGSEWRHRAMHLIRFAFPGYRWRAGASGGYGDRFWLVLTKKSPERDPSQAVIVFGGQDPEKWKTSVLRDLPGGDYEFESVRMTQEGKCALSVRSSRQNGGASEPGLFIYETNNEGASWRAPRFEPDILVPAMKLSHGERRCLLSAIKEATEDLRARIAAGQAHELTPPAKTPITAAK